MRHFHRIVVALAGSLLASAGPVGQLRAEQPSEDQVDESVDFSRQILPILSDKCFACHGPDTADPDMLRLDTFENATADRGGYAAIDTDRPQSSDLLARIRSADDPMPPADADKALSDSERTLLEAWISEGGRYAEHWAFVPPVKRSPPAIDPTDPVPGSAVMPDSSGAIDRFIARGLRQRSIDFAKPADPPTLARRAALVLCGLPPEPHELDQFLNDDSADAYDRYVDRLLAKPAFGEHQARHWLDAVRYGDTHGLHLDSRRGVYPYRDWVVLAINRDLPWDQFLHWQISGDLMPDPRLEQLVATGFVRMNPTSGEGGAIEEEYQAKNSFDRVENLGEALLGMTLTCARCHTHKYDPIRQVEYYRLMAFFNSTAEPALDRNKYDYGPTVLAPSDASQWARWFELERRLVDLVANADARIAADATSIDDTALDRWRQSGRERRAALLADPDEPFASIGLASEAATLVSEIESLRSRFSTTLVAKQLPQQRQTRLLRRGEYSLPVGDPLIPGVPTVLGELPDSTTPDRLALARWLTSRDHPTVARVLVNRLWQQTFGAGLVRTPEDFGLQGEYPTHPELLDWLAVELQDSGWNLKHLLRLFVTSRTFRQSSAVRHDIDDPENRLWSRGPAFRLDAEVIRDVALWTSGLLDTEMGGEGVKPYQPAGMWKALAHPASNTKLYEKDSGARLYRRSLYLYWKRTSPHPVMTLFDAPDRETGCVARSRTSTPLQSLALLNETQRVEAARRLARRLILATPNEGERLDLLFRLLACRSPVQTESDACRRLLEKMERRYTDSPGDAERLLSIGDAARDGGLDPTEHAAWTQVALTVLASDLALLVY